MAQRFKQAIDDGDLPSDADPAALACYLMTLNSGLAVQAKSGVKKSSSARSSTSLCATGLKMERLRSLRLRRLGRAYQNNLKCHCR